ncbi:MAG: hypothetical protein O3C43_05405 [Verrucomicrobia bacterium]|nr:hypothetical protein [Verrucomicrobiota bacterium]MDA1065920.1 hypothetical protein [Verrucomicrobiota bacterium]
MKNLSLTLLFILLFQTVQAVDEIQFRSINFQDNVVELFNFGNAPISLDGWRFCTHDENQIRQYSSPGGLNGVTIAAGASLFIYWDNNAPMVDANNINLISIGGGGGFAGPFDRGPFGMQLYFESFFGNGASIADHAQWSQGGVDNESADERSDEAEVGGVWTDQRLWIPTTAFTRRIELIDPTGARLHGPADYRVLEPIPLPPEFELTSFVYNPDGSINLTWENLSEFGVDNDTVQSSTDLKQWDELDMSGTNMLTFANAPAAPIFFRVVVE